MLAVALSFLVLMVFYPSLTARKKNATPVAKQEEAKTEAIQATIQKSSEEVPSMKSETVLFENDIYRVKFETRGAAISELQFKKKWKAPGPWK